MAKFYKSITLLCLIIFLLLVSNLDAGTYYVDKDHSNANDNNPGTETLPWKSIEKAVNTAIAGDTVIFKKSTTDYMVNSHLSFPNSGSQGNYIVFKAYSVNEKPVWNWGNNNFRIANKHFITIDGFVIKNMADGLYTKDGSSYIHIINNHIIGNDAGGNLVRVMGENCLISHNEIEHAGWNAVYLTSYSNDNYTPNGTIIEYNYIHDNNNHHAINIFPVTDDNNPLHIDGIIIRYNRIETSDWGIYTRYMRAFKIYNNIINDNKWGGIHLGGFDSDNSGAPNRKDPYDGLGAIVANNIIIARTTGTPKGMENNRINNMMFVNNIISSNHTYTFTYRNNDGGAHPTSNQTVDYNIFDGGKVDWGGSNYSSPSSWFSSITELNSNSLDTNPLLNNSGYDSRWNIPGAFDSQINSAAIDAGTNLLSFGILDDYKNITRPQGTNWDIGAFETISGPDIYPPEVIDASLLDSLTLKISFSEQLEPSTAQDINNYSITGGVSVFLASLSGSDVILSTSTHVQGSYTVTVNNVVDLAGNLISPENNSADYNMIILQEPGFPVDLFGTPESEKTAYFYLTIPDDAPEFITYHFTAFDADHGGNDPPEGHAFINDNGPVNLFPGATQENGDGIYNEFNIVVPKSWWINGVNKLRFVRLYSTGYRIDNASVIFDASSENESLIGFDLEQNYPNPFNPNTKIKFTVPNSSDPGRNEFVTLKVYDVLGMEVATLINKELKSGSYEVEFNPNMVGNSNLPSGIYFYTLRVKDLSQTKKMIFLK